MSDLISTQLQLAMSFHQAGQLVQAEAAYDKVLASDPDNADALHLLGVIAAQRTNFALAIRFFDRALIINPNFAEALSNRGLAFLDLNRVEEALASFDRALGICDDAESYNNRGIALQRLGRPDQALASYGRALGIDRGFAEAHNNRGLVLQELNRLDEALACFDDAIQVNAGYAEAHNNRGVVLQKLNRLDEALLSFDRALGLRGDYAEAHCNRGVVLQRLNRLDEALPSFDRALRLKPDYANAHVYDGMCRLLAGDFERGWQQCEWRWKNDYALRVAARDFPYPNWAGEALDGKSILIWGEQGVGDEILYAGLFPEMIARAERCVIECKAKLVPLFARSFPGAQVVPQSIPPHPATLADIDYQSATGSLPRWLRPGLESFPGHEGYLTPDKERVSHWKARLAALGPGLKVGISWRSSNLIGDRCLYCTELDQWAPILGVSGVHFVNLQYDDCAIELAKAREHLGATLHVFNEVDLFDDLLEAAALTKALDLVVSAPTSPSLLAAALGVPTWMMTYVNTWQTHGTEYVPWFPAMHLHARRWNEPWADAISKVAGHLRRASSQYEKTGRFDNR